MLKASAKLFFFTILLVGITQQASATIVTIDNSKNKDWFMLEKVDVQDASLSPSFERKILYPGEKFDLRLINNPLAQVGGAATLQIYLNKNNKEELICEFSTINDEGRTVFGNSHNFGDDYECTYLGKDNDPKNIKLIISKRSQ